jgi:hypothetical protein
VSDSPDRTEFCSTVIYPLASIDLRGLGAGWTRGPYMPTRTAGSGKSRFSAANRLRYIGNASALEPLFDETNRAHAVLAREHEQFTIDAIELIALDDSWSSHPGLLIVHLTQRPDAAPQAALERLARMARLGRAECRQLLAAVDEPTGRWDVNDAVPRAATVSQSITPPGDAPGLVRWEGSDAGDRRLVDLLTLPDTTRTLSTPLPVHTSRPSPVVEMAVSGTSVAAVRRKALPVELELSPGQIEEVQTFWTDAAVIELAQKYAAQSLVDVTLRKARTQRFKRWSKLAKDYRAWRTSSAWEAGIDHPVEAAVGRLMRDELGTERLLVQVDRELSDHDAVSVRRAAWLLSLVVGVFGIPPFIDAVASLIDRFG